MTSSRSYNRGAHRRRRPRRHGVVAAEMALTIPILLLFGLAGADFGRVAHFQQIVSNAARTAAETGATRQFTDLTQADWEAEVRQAALEELQSIAGFDEDNLEYSLTTSTDADGITRLEVSVAYPFRTAVAWPGLPAGVTLRARIETRQFR
jgi:Flp pilus assembly protein TadG